MKLVHRVGWDPEFTQRSAFLWPLARAAGRLARCTAFPTLEALDAVYAAEAAAHGARALCFRPDVRTRKRGGAQPALEERYDARIALRGEVPTRAEHWHDLLNALCFATFPRAKYGLHARQYRALQGRSGRPHARTREQDALTLFDEGGVVVAAVASAADALRAALGAGDLSAIASAEHAGRARVVPFGHALFEHMIEEVPCPGASARVLPFEALPCADDALLRAVDVALAAELARADRFSTASEALHLRLEELARCCESGDGARADARVAFGPRS